MFQFPGFALNPYGFRVQYLHLTPRSANTGSLLRSQYKGSKVGFPIRRFLDQSSFAAPQDLSQRTTSFIASQRQGIHQMLLRHLITLMINVRPAKAGHDLKKDLLPDFSSNIFLLAKHIRRSWLRARAGARN